MNKQEFKKNLALILSRYDTRKEYLGKDFYNFFLYYFSAHIHFPKMATFHKEWCRTAEKGTNIYIEGCRGIAKTTILWMAFEIWKICYKKTSFICNLCYDKKKAIAFNRMIVTELVTNIKLVGEDGESGDFWKLYSKLSSNHKNPEIAEKWIAEFITTSWIKVKAFWMGEAVRWEVFNAQWKWNVRPDHLFVDDIDNTKNTKNINIIQENMNFIHGEVLGSLAPDCQIIWSWNVIRKDGRNPRQKKAVKKNKYWKIFSNFLYGEAWIASWNIQWERYVETEKEARQLNKNILNKKNQHLSIEKIKELLQHDYASNFLWIPLLKWQTAVKEEWIQYTQEKVEFDYTQIGIDPAFSLKTWSDAIWIVVTGYKRIKEVWYKYVILCKKLEWEKKDEDIAEKIIHSLYNKYNCKRVVVEKNNGWELFGRLLQKKWMAVEVPSATKDKLTRFKEHEGMLMRWEVLFTPEAEELVDELLEFTGEDGWEDNLVDAFVWSLKEYNNKGFYFW